MKKLIVTGAIAALALSSVANAELELSGNVTVVTGYQHDDQDAGTTGAGGLTQGDLRHTPTANADHFAFMVDQAELDVENEFGENIRARIDMDLRDLGTGTLLRLEQAYVTANLSVGNGMEFLIGKFNAPVGIESVDRNENVFSTYTPSTLYLRPFQVIGAKLYYEFSDYWNFDLAVVNNINNIAGNSAMPSAIFRIGAVWGDEGRESNFNIAAAVGPEHATGTTLSSQNNNLDYAGYAWGNWALGEAWDLGWGVDYRQTTAYSAGANGAQKAMGGQLFGVYQASDVWTLQARYAMFWEFDTARTNGASTTGGTWNPNAGFEGMIHSGTLGATYEITDGAKMKLEYRFDWGKNDNGNDADYHTGVAEFAYSF